MTKPAVTYPDPERVAVDHLTTALAGEAVTVGADLPQDWTPAASRAHMQVSLDGTPFVQHPVAVSGTVRVTAWSKDPTEAKRLAALAHGLLITHTGDDFNATPLTGPLPAVDPDHDKAQLCSVTVRVRVRSIPIT